MHAKHTGIKRIRPRKRSFSHKGIRHRRVYFPDKNAQLLAGAGQNRAAAYEDVWFLCFRNQRDRRLKLRFTHVLRRNYRLRRFLLILRLIRRYILWNINQYRSRSSLLRNNKCFPDRIGKDIHVLYYIIMLCDRHCDSCNINFLEAVFSQKAYSHVTGNRHDGDRIHICGGNACHKIRRSRTAGRKTYADFSGRPCISVRRMRRSLFMGGQDMLNLITMLV